MYSTLLYVIFTFSFHLYEIDAPHCLTRDPAAAAEDGLDAHAIHTRRFTAHERFTLIFNGSKTTRERGEKGQRFQLEEDGISRQKSGE